VVVGVWWISSSKVTVESRRITAVPPFLYHGTCVLAGLNSIMGASEHTIGDGYILEMLFQHILYIVSNVLLLKLNSLQQWNSSFGLINFCSQ